MFKLRAFILFKLIRSAYFYLDQQKWVPRYVIFGAKLIPHTHRSERTKYIFQLSNCQKALQELAENTCVEFNSRVFVYARH